MANSRLLTREKLIAKMRKRQGRRTQKAFAAELGISEPFLSDIYAGKRDPGVKVLSKLGLASLTAYEEQHPASSKMPRKASTTDDSTMARRRKCLLPLETPNPWRWIG